MAMGPTGLTSWTSTGPCTFSPITATPCFLQGLRGPPFPPWAEDTHPAEPHVGVRAEGALEPPWPVVWVGVQGSALQTGGRGWEWSGEQMVQAEAARRPGGGVWGRFECCTWGDLSPRGPLTPLDAASKSNWRFLSYPGSPTAPGPAPSGLVHCTPVPHLISIEPMFCLLNS